jgi:hypothetical protein
MVTVASIYLRFYIKVGVGVGIFTDSDSSQNSFWLRLHDSDATALLQTAQPANQIPFSVFASMKSVREFQMPVRQFLVW